MKLTNSTTLRLVLAKRMAQLGESPSGMFKRTLLKPNKIRHMTNTSCARNIKLEELFEFLRHAHLVLVVNGKKCHRASDLEEFTDMLNLKLYDDFLGNKGDFIQYYTGMTPNDPDYNSVSYQLTQLLNSQKAYFDTLAAICHHDTGFDYELRLVSVNGSVAFDSENVKLTKP